MFIPKTLRNTFRDIPNLNLPQLDKQKTQS